ncbi:MAG: aldehyde:ferredoxin oxidoreductase [Candidatus Heimdallarchaeota archaeon]|nr:MAG: aldehyde:ferredoxin oxidoreductase [Candidatus Heimdallarchaeota archaeon]
MGIIADRILVIDLTTNDHQFIDGANLFAEWIGGVGVGINLLNQYVPSNADPLGSDNAIIFAIGSLSTFYPIISKTVTVFRSPLTNDLGESYAGGRLSLALRFANIGALVIIGKAKKPSIVTIIKDEVKIRPAGPLAHMYTSTIGRVLRELIPAYPGKRSILRIGQAGENLVRYSNIVVDTLRHFGRLGAGAVLGSKNLKAIVISGNQNISLNQPKIDRRAYSKTYSQIWDLCVNTEVMKKYHVLGTAQNILPLNELNALPTKNFLYGKFTKAIEISGEKFIEVYLGRRVSCNTCPVGCIHVGILRERYGKDLADIHSTSVPYDYEPMVLLGPTLLIGDGKELMKLLELTEKYGMDAITTGGVLGYLAEAYEKKIITDSDTGGLPIRFGNVEDFLEVVHQIALRTKKNRNLFWWAGEGLDALVKKYGGSDIALRFNNHTPAGYSTGPYSMIGHAIGGRHSHLDNAGYSLDLKLIGKELQPNENIMKLVKEEEWRNTLNSLVICLFARNLYTPQLVVECFRSLGITITEDELKKIGFAIQELRIKTKIRFGFNYQEIKTSIPKRLFEMESGHGKLSKSLVTEYLELYNSILRERYQIKP